MTSSERSSSDRESVQPAKETEARSVREHVKEILRRLARRGEKSRGSE